MYFSDIRIRYFRNLESVDLSLSKNVNLFIGDNGQGKSNFLEALYYAAQGSSFRPIEKSSLIHKSFNDQALVKATINHSDLESELILRLSTQKNKLVTLNGKRVAKQKLVQLLPMILFSPDSLTAIKQGPDERRKLLDEFIVSTSGTGAQILQDFKKCLKNRNRILSKIAESDSSSSTDLATLDSLNQIYFSLCLKVTELRLQALRDLKDLLHEATGNLFKDTDVDISVSYVISGEESNHKDSSEILTQVLMRADQLRAAELSAGTSLVGPHKHDIKFIFNGEDSRFFCSQGQQRALILAFKIAHVRYFQIHFNRSPILMLDDVLSELDLQRRRFLIQFLKEIDAQIFLTSTDLQMLDQFGDHLGLIFKVSNGQITIENNPQIENFMGN